MRAGRYLIRAIETDHFRLDGGAMFGSVPRALWSRYVTPDEHHRIPLVTRVLLAEGDGRCILVDTGTGHLWSEKEAAMYGLPAPEIPGVVTALESAGVNATDITDVILTHLHFDHAGGVTMRGESGDPVPTFPNATCHLQRRNLEAAQDPNERERKSYLRRHWEPIQGPRLRLYEGEGEILPDVHVTVSDGHTNGLQVVRFGEGASAVVYPADMIPLSTHVRVPWVMGYDLCPRLLMKEKRRLLEVAAQEGHVLMFEHDSGIAAAQVKSLAGGFERGEVVDIT